MEKEIVNNYVKGLGRGIHYVEIVEVEFRIFNFKICVGQAGIALVTFSSLDINNSGIFKSAYFIEDVDPAECIETAFSRKYFLDWYLKTQGTDDFANEHLDLVPYIVDEEKEIRKFTDYEGDNKNLFVKNKKTGKVHFVGERFYDLIPQLEIDSSFHELYDFKNEPEFFDGYYRVNRKTKERIKSIKFAEKINKPLMQLFSDVGEPINLSINGFDIMMREYPDMYGPTSYLESLVGKRVGIEICTEYEKKTYDKEMESVANAKNEENELSFDNEPVSETLEDAGFYLDVDGNMHEIEIDDEDIWGDMVAEEERNYDREHAYDDIEDVLVVKHTFPITETMLKKRIERYNEEADC